MNTIDNFITILNAIKEELGDDKLLKDSLQKHLDVDLVQDCLRTFVIFHIILSKNKIRENIKEVEENKKTEIKNEIQPLEVYLTPKQFVEKHEFMPMGGLRHLLFNSHQNGLEKALRRIGKRKILISETGFFDWMKEKNSRGN